MGEYAIRTDDKSIIKIGTCENMYYIRYEDRMKVSHLEGSLDCSTAKNLYWRIPFPDEDVVKIGEYSEYARGESLYQLYMPESIDNPGTVQISHESGVLLNIRCYHGLKLPEGSEEIHVFWNGKNSNNWILSSIKNTEEGIRFVVSCKYCGNSWLCEWDEIQSCITDSILRDRLIEYMMKDT